MSCFQGGLAMQNLNRLTLNQETLKELTSEELHKVEGGRITPVGYTCPECASPPDTYTCLK